MLKQALIYSSTIILLASCSALKPLNFSNSKQVNSTAGTANTQNREVKFLEEISVPVQKSATNQAISKATKENTSAGPLIPDMTGIEETNAALEHVSSLQLKYAVLLNTEPGSVSNVKMFEFIDEWYGTRYRLGGTTKNGIDCSAFVQFFFTGVYGVSLPRTAREQYKATSRISRTELQEGDLVFFNTRGGVSHCGVYLQNNKFVHAASSGGVMISDLYDDYWARRFVGAGRIDEKPGDVSNFTGKR